MSLTRDGEGNRQRPLRLWPGVTAVVLQWLLWFGVPAVMPEAGIVGVLGGLVGGLVVLLWWAFFSRAPRAERWGAILLIVIAMAATTLVLHTSIAGGMMGMMFVFYALPIVSFALVAWAVATRNLAAGSRRAALVAAILIACGVFALLRTNGITGEGRAQFAWRWTPSPEEQLLARAASEPATPPQATPAKVQAPEERSVAPVASEPKTVPAAVAASLPTAPSAPPATAPAASDWPGFRGPNRDSKVVGVRINTDWAASPPVELWRRPAGPGWSSFAVRDSLVYTQEQRGDFEVVACYNASTGEPVWTHKDNARFYESNAGAGPRGTPALHGGRVYTLGATGIVNALDARTGAVAWTRNAASDTGAKVPGWGFSGSPVVIDDLVIVAASGRMAAYELATGNPRWTMQAGAGSYSSPQVVTLDGVTQIVMLTGEGATSVAPADGKVLWKHAWPGSTILQPAVTADGGLLITTGDMSGGAGTRRLTVAKGPSGWTAEEVWTSNGLKPYFNDLVVHKGHAFGFDGSILSCIDLRDGKRKWKGGRYGHGQMLLLAEQDLLLVLSEEGELALVRAVPGQFTEVARIPAIEGKTWNHPAIVGNVLLVRNGQEMVAFRLPAAGS